MAIGVGPRLCWLPRRIRLLGTRVNKGMKKGRGCYWASAPIRENTAYAYSSSPTSLIFSGAIFMVSRTSPGRRNG